LIGSSISAVEIGSSARVGSTSSKPLDVTAIPLDAMTLTLSARQVQTATNASDLIRYRRVAPCLFDTFVHVMGRIRQAQPYCCEFDSAANESEYLLIF
jgi:hypothetical protein